ncbi:condensation domain-containing protein [Massilia sp. B-10]|nr:condensation domain-containing protein [Massilia sp. B-10]
MLPLVTLTQEQIDAIVLTVPQGVANIQDIYPLAPLQAGILFHHMMQEQGDAYLLRSVLSFDTRVRMDRFLAALQTVIDRHDILRSAVLWSGLPAPVQVVYRHAELPVAEIAADGGDAMAQLLATTDPRVTRMDVQRAPMLSAACVQDGSGEWHLALMNHHLVADHVTLEFIVAEIQLLMAGQDAALLTTLPYRNFIAQTLTLSEADQESYFRAQLGDIDEPCAPFGLLDVQGSGGQVEEKHHQLGDALAKDIRAAARQHGVTPAVLFHASAGHRSCASAAPATMSSSARSCRAVCKARTAPVRPWACSSIRCRSVCRCPSSRPPMRSPRPTRASPIC